MTHLTQLIKLVMSITHDKTRVIFLLLPNISKRICTVKCQLLLDNLLSINFIYLFLNNNKRNSLNLRLCKGGRSQYLIWIKNTFPQNNIILNRKYLKTLKTKTTIDIIEKFNLVNKIIFSVKLTCSSILFIFCTTWTKISIKFRKDTCCKTKYV